MIEPFNHLGCPLDGQPMNVSENGWQCPSGHSFDVARQGYVNLLPVQNKRSKQPGDSKEMVGARQRFLASGSYAAIADEVSRAVFDGSNSVAKPLACLDAGCGDGYYLRHLAGVSPVDLELIGLDISKWAVRAAAARDREMRWVVGTNAHLPIIDGSLDRILCLFGFPVFEEFRRVLAPGGRVIVAEAGENHLIELRRVVYDEIKPARRPREEAPAGFSMIHQQCVSETVHLDDSGTVQSLLAMTPHLYRAKSAGRQRAEALDELTVTVDVRVTTLEVDSVSD